MASFFQKLWAGAKQNPSQPTTRPKQKQEETESFDYASIACMPVKQRANLPKDRQIDAPVRTRSPRIGMENIVTSRKRRADDTELKPGNRKRARYDGGTSIRHVERQSTGEGQVVPVQGHSVFKESDITHGFIASGDLLVDAHQAQEDDVASGVLERPLDSILDTLLEAGPCFRAARFPKSSVALRKKAKRYYSLAKVITTVREPSDPHDRLRGIGLWPGSDAIPGIPSAAGRDVEVKTVRVPRRLGRSVRDKTVFRGCVVLGRGSRGVNEPSSLE